MALADFIQGVLNRHLGILQDERTCGRAVHPHFLLFLPCRYAREILLHDEARELFTVHLPIDHKAAGIPRVRDKHLLAVEDVVFTIL